MRECVVVVVLMAMTLCNIVLLEYSCIHGCLQLDIFSYQIFFSPQHLTAARLQLSVIADDARLERDLFLNLGAVANLSLDLAASAGGRPNTSTAALALPATKWRPGVPNSVFLQELKLGQKAFPCTCSSVG